MWGWLVQSAPSQVLLDLYTKGVLDDSLISVTVVDEDAPESDLIIAIAGFQRLYTVTEQVTDALSWR
jgi:hypothetical protein